MSNDKTESSIPSEIRQGRHLVIRLDGLGLEELVELRDKVQSDLSNVQSQINKKIDDRAPRESYSKMVGARNSMHYNLDTIDSWIALHKSRGIVDAPKIVLDYFARIVFARIDSSVANDMWDEAVWSAVELGVDVADIHAPHGM